MSNINYGELLLAFQPRTIQTEEEYKHVQREIDRLIDQSDLSPAEQEYLDLLATLLCAYAEQVEDKMAYTLRGVALVKGLLELHELKRKDLEPIFKTKSGSTGSHVVDSVESIRRLLCQTCLSRFFVAAAGFNRWYPCQPHGFQMSHKIDYVRGLEWTTTLDG